MKTTWLSIQSIYRPKKITMACTLLLLFIAQAVYCQTFTVTSTANSGGGTLRFAITQVNLGLYDTIHFNIPTSDGGYNAQKNTWTINPVTDLPSIIKPVTIDGYSQPGSSVNTLAQGNNAVLTIVLNGINDPSDGYAVGNGLHFLAGSDGSIIRGLVINRWALNGILVDGANGSINGIQILGNFIGTDSTGTQPIPTRTGVGLSGLVNPITNTLIGTVNPADRNLFGGSFGYMIFDSYEIRGACICSSYNNGTTIVNNYIGTDRTGTEATGLSQCGILFLGENYNAVSPSTIGGALSTQLNLISGQTLYGISFTSDIPATFEEGFGCVQCTIQGNYIGTDITGTVALSNRNGGINFNSGATNNLIIDNLVSGNGTGIQLGQKSLPGTLLNTVQGNYIGTDATGSVALGNLGFGIIVNDNQNTIGGTSISQANLISGNGEGGILIYGLTHTDAVGNSTDVNDNTVTTNFIGTDLKGKLPIPNGGNGVQIGAIGPSFSAGKGNQVGI
jgi:hypothetical protein